LGEVADHRGGDVRGHLARVVTAHPVGHDHEAHVRVHGEIVLVVGPHAPGVGGPGNLEALGRFHEPSGLVRMVLSEAGTPPGMVRSASAGTPRGMVRSASPGTAGTGWVVSGAAKGPVSPDWSAAMQARRSAAICPARA